MSARACSRISCSDEAVATLTFSYADSMAVLGPLAGTHEPHTYDLCDRHARLTSAPQGWQLIRHRIVSIADAGPDASQRANGPDTPGRMGQFAAPSESP
ncbi:DUF3499 family protein [Cryobacterium sp. SO2]|uniref:DUF3499 family protein n=1 Tax=Cryobacterium sp. SO2 TaxID=1897060 RepID=UPI00223E857D|nr:DUF3499 family protein [Cryobacterium sp. SO2]WEO78168.1 DUF3499 family protein [Cryobacterium sp. SO2]